MPANSSQSAIYALADPESPSHIRYIGKSNNPSSRLKSHIREAMQPKKKRTKVRTWIKALCADGRIPKMTILEWVPHESWQFSEIAAIAKYRAAFSDLLNMSDGGLDPGRCSPEVSAANARNAVAKRDPRLWQLKRDLRKSLDKGWVNESTKKRLRAAVRRHPKLLACFADV